MLTRSASSVFGQQEAISIGPLGDRGLSPPRTTAPAGRLAGRGGLCSPDQFGPSRMRETVRVSVFGFLVFAVVHVIRNGVIPTDQVDA